MTASSRLYPYKTVTRLENIPDKPHYAIVVIDSIYIPGDERSRTNPGHGYPASTECYPRYMVFETKQDWETEIEALTRRSTPFKALYVTPATISTKVEVEIPLPPLTSV